MLFITYCVLLIGLILYNGCFNLFVDDQISKKQFALMMAGKILAIPFFMLVYEKMYGGLENLDAGKFYHDVLLISDRCKKDLNFCIRFVFGFQNETPGSYDYEYAFRNTLNWTNGKAKTYFYNDNRLLIKMHVLFNFIAFDYYKVHALLSCFMSFVGINYLYKSFKNWFVGKEFLLLFILCFLPSLWFYTGALLKEGFLIFLLGLTIFKLKQNIYQKTSLWTKVSLVVLLMLSSLFKPYLLLFSAACFGLFFAIQRLEKIKSKSMVFTFSLALLLLVANFVSIPFKGKSLIAAALKQRETFISLAKGGIFLENKNHFVRLPDDTSLINSVNATNKIFTIKRNAAFMYWKTGQSDTLFNTNNRDTITRYEFVDRISESHSNISICQKNLYCKITDSFYYTFFFPLFYNAKGLLQIVASVENLMICLAFITIVIGVLKNKKEPALPFTCLFICLFISLLISFLAPNMGAIFRYRSPSLLFLLVAALYYVKFPIKRKKLN